MINISVITVSFNAKHCIAATMASIRGQGNVNFEYIVVDGDSTDGTIDIIHENEDIVDKLLVEKDSGIYHAMNKGLQLARGRYVYFLNAGDQLKRGVLEEVERVIEERSPTMVYGDLQTSSKVIPVRNMYRNKFRGIPHQACFYNKDSIGMFDTRFKVCADFKQYLLVRVIKGFDAQYISNVVAEFDSIKPDKDVSQRRSYDILRTKEKIFLVWSQLTGTERIYGTLFYLYHYLKFRLCLSRRL